MKTTAVLSNAYIALQQKKNLPNFLSQSQLFLNTLLSMIHQSHDALQKTLYHTACSQFCIPIGIKSGFT
jgi:hypothetical protein